MSAVGGGNRVATHHPAPTAKRKGAKRPKLACTRHSALRTATSHKRRGVLVMKGSAVRIRSSALPQSPGVKAVTTPFSSSARGLGAAVRRDFAFGSRPPAYRPRTPGSARAASIAVTGCGRDPRSNSSNKCAYVLKVRIASWPSCAAVSTAVAPDAINSDANVCLRSYGR
jgi:hypothetical protein